MKRLISFVLILNVTFSLCIPAGFAQSTPSITAPSIVLLEPGTRKILYSRSPKRKQPAASTTKIVTALIAIERLPLDRWVTVSAQVESVEASKLYLKGGEQLKVRDLLKAILMKSANDAAAALAIEISGSEHAFAKVMTQKARRLGAKNTRFVNASGLPGKGQYSTAYDLAIIMNEATKNPVIISILKQKNAVIRTKTGKRYFLKSHNKMLWKEPNVIGKTGWTRSSRYCFLGLIEVGKREAIVAMLGSHRLWSDVSALFNKFLRLIGAKRDRLLANGTRGSDVRKLQNALKKAGYFHVKPTGYFGPKTQAAVIKFQKAKHLRMDGIVGPQTRMALASYY